MSRSIFSGVVGSVNVLPDRTLSPFYARLHKLAESDRRENKVLHYIPNTDFRLGHDGLAKLAKKKRGIEVEDLKIGEFVVFVNNAKTGVKLYAAAGTVVYQKVPQGQRLVPGAIALIPWYFNGKKLDLEGANVQAIKTDFAKYMRDKESRSEGKSFH